MKKAFLIYNPASGRKRKERAECVARVAAIFRNAGVQVETAPTTAAGSAVRQAQEAAEAGFDTIVACGGDGTANEALNGLMQSSAGDVALGLVPLGSGNLMAYDLRLPSDPLAAAQKLLRYQPRAFRPGLVSCQGKDGPQQR